MKAFWLTILGAALTGLDTRAMNNPASAPSQADLAGSLRQTVATLAEKEKRAAVDYARMAEETISFGSKPESIEELKKKMPDAFDPHAPWRNMVNDALAGVDEGERLDPKTADWPDLRDRLKKLQPPPPPPSQGGSKKDKQDKNKSQKKDKKDQKGSGKDKQQQPSGGGQKGEEQEGGEGQQGEGESEGAPSQGQPGKGNRQGGQDEGDAEGSGGGEEQAQQKQAHSKDPNQARDFSTSKEGEGQMKERGRNDEMKGMEDTKAGFGSLGQEKREGKEQQGAAVGQGGSEERSEAPPGMRVVGGGSGQKANDKTGDPVTLEAMSRLDQVKQSDSPAILQQRLQPQDQRPQPSSLGKPW